VEPSSNPRLAHCGSIATGLNTGRLALVARDAAGEIAGRAALEVRSRTRLRVPPPAETHVLIGWFKSEAHLKWVLEQKLYNFRMDTSAGSLRLKPEVSGAQYLLLHSYKGKTSSGLFRVAKEGPRVLSQEKLKEKGYPGAPSQLFYLVYDVVPAPGFDGYEWDYSKLPERLQNRQSAEPQTVTLDELMAVAKENLLAGAGGG
jgi:hypothetical protein